MMHKRSLSAFALCFAALAAACTQGAFPRPEQDRRPNFLLIVVDDMGMADLGSFGGEIRTPNLDRLALGGLRLTNFHTAPVCSATRAMLLTGVDNHKAGFGNLAEELAPNQKGRPGHEGELNDRVVTVASLLRDAGYKTYVTGKWHLGASLRASPWARGFDHSFTLLSGGASHFPDMRPAYHPDPEGRAPYRRDRDMVEALPDNFRYSTQFYVDRMIDDLHEHNPPGVPFLAYLAFTAPHWPLQAPAATIEKYRGAYDSGFDRIRAARLARQKALGIIPADADENAAPPNAVAWDTLSSSRRRREARAMEIYAAMIDEIDHHVGRLIRFLESRGDLDDTVIVFISDNGAEGHGLDDTFPPEPPSEIRRGIDERHDFSLENMGAEKSFVFYGPNWARAGAPAFRLHKGFPTEGGIRVSAFVHHEMFPKGQISDHFFSVKDIAPTILELAGVSHPAPAYKGRTVEEASGLSMVGMLTAGDGEPMMDERIEGGEILGKYFVRKGPWKLVHVPPPHGQGRWELYNLADDLAERHDLAERYPERVRELDEQWQRYARENGVILPNWVSGY